jgi:Fur family peroxide stress response transcriptional regulator
MEPKTKHFRKRDAILSCVRGTDVHPSADWVYARLKPEYPDISLGTVYRNLALFKEQGLILSLGTVKGVERFDGNVQPHVHFVCTQCDGVTDLPQIYVPQSLCSRAAAETGGQVDTCQLSFTGVCRRCCASRDQ